MVRYGYHGNIWLPCKHTTMYGWAVSRYFSNTVVLELDDTCIVLISVERYYRFRYYHSFTVSRIAITILLKTKAWYSQNQINEKDQNTLIEQSIHKLLVKPR